MNKLKWISVGIVGSLFAVSHIGMIGYIATREKEAPLPSVDLPVGKSFVKYFLFNFTQEFFYKLIDPTAVILYNIYLKI